MDTILLVVGAIAIAVIVYLAVKPKKKQQKDTVAPPVDITKLNIPDQVFGTKIPKIPTQENRTPGE